MDNAPETTLTEDRILGIIEYGSVLRRIHNRLVAEGYFLENKRTWNIFKAGKVMCTFEEEW